mgnify:CR=1 FL=1
MKKISKLYTHIIECINESKNNDEEISYRTIPTSLILNEKPRVSRMYVAIAELHKLKDKNKFKLIKCSEIEKVTGIKGQHQGALRLRLETLGLIEFKEGDNKVISYKINVPTDGFIYIESRLLKNVSGDFIKKFQALLLSNDSKGLKAYTSCKDFIGRRLYNSLVVVRDEYTSDSSLYESLNEAIEKTELSKKEVKEMNSKNNSMFDAFNKELGLTEEPKLDKLLGEFDYQLEELLDAL